ncbi:hypothetical protein CEXT_208161 [Caerostris extrusa]|uniref:Uncharacterized protein n=1 Tax=Caerostris extrusa TaxID=172846 RepID=A0AAV4S2C4_CAEEX|nr:hypothetical protein CEXT_208161 [Caerostris extrusa]
MRYRLLCCRSHVLLKALAYRHSPGPPPASHWRFQHIKRFTKVKTFMQTVFELELIPHQGNSLPLETPPLHEDGSQIRENVL